MASKSNSLKALDEPWITELDTLLSLIEDEVGESDTDSKSGSNNSRRSSIMYNIYPHKHEPYETYKHKVKELMAEIGAHNVRLLDRIRGGSFNRVIPVEFTRSSLEDPEHTERAILRIPRSYDEGWAAYEDAENDRVTETVLSQAAILHFLECRSLLIPSVLAYDALPNNALGRPYMLLRLLAGTRLDRLWGNMSHEERHSVVDQLTDFMVACEKVELPGGLYYKRGHFVYSRPIADSENQAEHDQPMAIEGFGTDGLPDATKTAPCRDLYSVLRKRLAYQITKVKNLDCEYHWGYSGYTADPAIEMLERLQQVMDQMKHLGFFPINEPDVLYHIDMEPRNILFAPEEENGVRKWRLTGVIDWDCAVSLAPILTRMPRSWIWDFYQHVDGARSDRFEEDYDLLDQSWYTYHLSEEDRKLKDHFEQSLVQKLSQLKPGYTMERYQEETYRSGRWLRRLSRFADCGIKSDEDWQRYENFMQEWSDFQAEKGE